MISLRSVVVIILYNDQHPCVDHYIRIQKHIAVNVFVSPKWLLLVFVVFYAFICSS
jgi:hypothetical protein